MGTSVLMLEKEQPQIGITLEFEPLGWRGLNTPSIEIFYQHRLLDKLFNRENWPSTIRKTPGFQFGVHFGGIMLNANKLELDRWKYRFAGPALTSGPTTINQIEAILT
ncbi:hypothetical protein BOTCAL_0060g00340 [Botryotinia calthae]|uniref:Uncharacterized protein n=1 Tax=Botryotinia calthae TaxID=38488 RepID=A0A4Y8DAE5_9HELO|nr:hypothetical protein BOTCAL_0060g00340 [Botryotinia calthae]